MNPTSQVPLSSLWLWRDSFHPLMAPNIAAVLCHVIEAADQGKMPRAHEVWCMASKLAFMRTHSLECRSATFFCFRYFAVHVVDTPCVAMGLHPLVNDFSGFS